MVSFYVLHFFTSDIWMKSPNLYSSLRRHVRPAGIFRLCNKSRTSTDFSAGEISACFSTDSFLGRPVTHGAAYSRAISASSYRNHQNRKSKQEGSVMKVRESFLPRLGRLLFLLLGLWCLIMLLPAMPVHADGAQNYYSYPNRTSQHSRRSR